MTNQADATKATVETVTFIILSNRSQCLPAGSKLALNALDFTAIICRPDVSATLLHGGLDNDLAFFTDKQSDDTIQRHKVYLLAESSDAQPAIAGLYREVLQHQPAYLGFDWWATAQ
jgi:hypothetical protein